MYVYLAYYHIGPREIYQYIDLHNSMIAGHKCNFLCMTYFFCSEGKVIDHAEIIQWLMLICNLN